MSASLAWQDYMATGMPDLLTTYEDRVHNRTQVGFVDSTGLVNTTKGRHLVGWDPVRIFIYRKTREKSERENESIFRNM